MGVFAIGYGVYTRQLSLVSRHWPTTAGVIVVSHLDTSGEGDVVMIRYHYQVEGRAYEGDVVTYGGNHNDPELLPRYPLGARVEVHYDPRDAAKAVLEPGPGPAPAWFVVIGVGFLGYGFWRGLDVDA